MRVWIVLISLFFPQLVSAQFSLDSLRHIWLNESNPDSIRLNAMNRMVEHGYIRSYLDTFKHYNNQYIDLAIKANSKKHWSRGLMGIAVYHLNMNNTMEGVRMLDSAQKMAREVNYTYGIEGVNSVFGIIKIFQGDQSGVDICQQAYERFVELDDLMGMVNSASFLSRAYGIIGDNKQCFYYAKVSLERAKDLGYWSFLASAYHVMADVYLRLGIHEQGDVFHEKALEFCRKGQYIGEEMLIYGHIAGIAFNNGEYDIALKELLKVETFNLASNNPFQAQSTNAKIIYLYASMGNVEGAKTRITTYEKTEIKGLQSKGNSAMVNAAKGMLFALEGKFEESNALLISSSKEFAATNQNINEIRAYKTLIQNYKELGNFKQAVLYHEKLDSINSNEKEKALIQNVQKFELHRLTLKDSLAQVEKDRIVEKNHKDELDKKNKAKNLAIGSGFILLLLAGAFYSRFLYVRKAKYIIEKEKHRSDELLLNILPAEVAEELKNTGESEAKHFDEVSILFTDFKGFTQASELLSAKDLVNEINTCFKAFDHICDKYGIEKIKTIGDSYMAAAGLKSNVQGPMSTSDIRLWTQDTTLAALEMQQFMTQRNKELETRNSSGFEMRCGIHTGPVVAGIVGVKKFQYDIWGDTVNTASRMESHGEVGKVNISQATYLLLKDDPQFTFESRGMIEAKGKGEMEMFFAHLKD